MRGGSCSLKHILVENLSSTLQRGVISSETYEIFLIIKIKEYQKNT